MSEKILTTRFRFWVWLIRAIGVIVPRRLRADWRQEWEAELQYRELLLADWERLNWRTKFDLLRRSLGALGDALWLQSYRWEDDMFQDLRYGIRILFKQPGFTLIAVFTLALGIGASTAIFSAVNPILFKPLPYPHADRIDMIWDFGADNSRLYVTFGTYRELTERSHSLEMAAVMRPWQPVLTGGAQSERIEGQRVSASYFQTLGLSPAQGRDFNASDDEVNAPGVVIINDELWRRRFNSDPGIIGQQVRFDDNPYTVIGVMPRAFENILTPAAEIWSPLRYDKTLPPDSREWGHHLRMVARLRAGVTNVQAKRELDAIAQAPVPEFSRPSHAALGQGLTVNSLQDDMTSGVKPALLAVLVAVLLVLAIACVNVTNLLLARGAQRRGEFAIRAALGAPRMRMVRQLLTESLLLALIGGVLGMGIAEFGVRAIVALSPPGLPRIGAIRIDGATFVFALAITTLVGVAVGLIPALQVSNRNLNGELKQSSRRTAGGHQLTRRFLVVAEVALALMLLVSAGLLLRSLQRLFSIDPGLNSSHLITMQVQTSGHRFNEDVTHRFFDQALESVRHVPGVESAAFTSQLPLSGELEDGYGAHFESSPTTSPDVDNGALRYAVSPDYFETMSIPLRRGRLLNDRDIAAAPLAVVVSESLADSKFPDANPIGQRLRIGPDGQPWYTIVGVVGDVKQTSLALSQSEAVYMTTVQWKLFADRTLWLVARTRGDSAALAPDIRNAIWAVDKDQPVVRVTTMDDLVAASAAERHFALILFETFGLVALVLSAIGIYGVLSGNVTERTREIGVRLALGAQQRDVLRLILQQGFKLTFVGVGVGLLASWAATRLLAKLLYGVSATDPLIFGGVAVLLIGVALLACYFPARRATQVDPLVALKQE